MYQESLFSCQAWQAATNPTFKFGNAPGHEKEKVTVADTLAKKAYSPGTLSMALSEVAQLEAKPVCLTDRSSPRPRSALLRGASGVQFALRRAVWKNLSLRTFAT